jgi:hypothetical protein
MHVRIGRSRLGKCPVKVFRDSVDGVPMDLLETLVSRQSESNLDRWFAIGRSHASDLVSAAHEACGEALAQSGTADTVKLAIVFAATEYCNDVFLAAMKSLLPNAEVIGCSTAGEISVVGHDARANDASVVVALLGGSQLRIATTTTPMHDPLSLRTNAAEAAQVVEQISGSPYRTLLALSDGMSRSDQCEIVRGVYDTAGATVPLIGGCAGDHFRMTQTIQMHGTTVHENSMVLTAIGSDAPIGVGVAHGWRSVGEPMFATAVDGTEVLELDNRPAVDVYLERLGADPKLGTDLQDFTSFALTHPLALVRRRGDEIRWVNGADLVRRSLRCNVDIQRNAQVWLTEGDCQSTIDAVGVACNDAVQQLEGRTPIGAIAFNCAARRAVLGPDGLVEEVAEIANHLGGIPVAGFYTYGEFARVRGPNGFHNQTLVMLVFS